MNFKAEMVAPCGLDCNICSQALIEHNPCPGCNGPDKNKPEFCAMHCGIILCQKRRENGYTYCDECPDCLTRIRSLQSIFQSTVLIRKPS